MSIGTAFSDAWKKFRNLLAGDIRIGGNIASDMPREAGTVLRAAAHKFSAEDHSHPSENPDAAGIGNRERSTEERDSSRDFPDRSIPLLEHMDPEVDALIRRYDHTLAQRILDLRGAGWEIRYGEIGSGNRTRFDPPVINIDGVHREDTLKTVSILAHETNHAHPDGYHPQNKPDERKTPERVVAKVQELLEAEGVADRALRDLLHDPRWMHNRTSWAAARVWEQFKNEGDAEIALRDSRKRILKNGGPDIGPGFDDAEINGIYERYERGEISRETAREEIGYEYGISPGASLVHPDFEARSYLEYYSEYYGKSWDNTVTELLRKQGR
ncbi:hypothetical protein [Nocardia sp. NPDC049149]|uniref:hypothetical protein n=1 Tax=Nocardia sp. NPDC049149 TaxID=3364315 RepID=UPI0037112258